MIRSWVALGLCLGLTSIAEAESGIPLVTLTVPAEIPSDGVLPLYGCRDARCSNLASVVVTDVANGTRLEGRVELVLSEAYWEGWGYFVPSVPFRSGATYSVFVMGGFAGRANVVSLSAADLAGLDEGALRLSESLAEVRTVRDRRCCSVSSCIDVSVVKSVMLSASLSAQRPIATQYLFELSMHTEGATGTIVAAYRPLRADYGASTASLDFESASASYCYTVRARPIVGGEPFTLMTRCVANEFTDLGQEDRTPAEVAQWAAACETTPSHVDAGVIDRADAATDADAVPAVDKADAATDADGEPLGRGVDSKLGENESGCQLAGGRSQVFGMAWPVALLALRLKKRRRAA